MRRFVCLLRCLSLVLLTHLYTTLLPSTSATTPQTPTSLVRAFVPSKALLRPFLSTSDAAEELWSLRGTSKKPPDPELSAPRSLAAAGSHRTRHPSFFYLPPHRKLSKPFHCILFNELVPMSQVSCGKADSNLRVAWSSVARRRRKRASSVDRGRCFFFNSVFPTTLTSLPRLLFPHIAYACLFSCILTHVQSVSGLFNLILQ